MIVKIAAPLLTEILPIRKVVPAFGLIGPSINAVPVPLEPLVIVSQLGVVLTAVQLQLLLVTS